MKRITAKFAIPLGLVLAGLLAGCGSTPVNVSAMAPTHYKVLGKAKGQSCGALGFFGTAYYFVPLGLNGRVERAQEEAIKSVPGATGLINVELQDDWGWVIFATSKCSLITGDAIREEK